MTDRQLKCRRRRAHGFSLVEILVGLAIGMLAVIIIMQVFAVNEATKRTTTGGADATTNGTTALYLTEREVAMAGWGLESALYLGRPDTANPIVPGCETYNHYCGGASCSGADWSLAPVSITDGGTGPDSITLRYFADPEDANFVPSPTATVYSNAVVVSGATSVPTLKVSTNFSCKKGDLVLVSDPTGATCTLVQVSDVPGTTPGDLTLPHLSGTDSPYNNPDWDTASSGGKPPIVTSTTTATCFAPASDGPTSRRIFSVDTTDRVLKRFDSATATTSAIASGIVDMQAQYGIAADGSQVVSDWVDATGGAGWDNPVPKAGTSGITTKNRLQNIKAVRIALVARSSEYQKPSGSTCDATSTSVLTAGSTGWSTWATFDDSGYPADWQCYRYREFEITVPVRNIIWGSP
jgi:type IV pilus assembly protein PilW